MTGYVLFGITLLILGALLSLTSLYPLKAVELILSLFVPGWKVCKARKRRKVKKVVKKMEEKGEKGEVFP